MLQLIKISINEGLYMYLANDLKTIVDKFNIDSIRESFVENLYDIVTMFISSHL